MFPESGRALNFERFTIKQVVTFERFDDKKIDRKPDRTAPVRIAPEKVAVPFARNIIDAVFFVARTENIRCFVMRSGN